MFSWSRTVFCLSMSVIEEAPYLRSVPAGQTVVLLYAVCKILTATFFIVSFLVLRAKLWNHKDHLRSTSFIWNKNTTDSCSSVPSESGPCTASPHWKSWDLREMLCHVQQASQRVKPGQLRVSVSWTVYTDWDFPVINSQSWSCTLHH